MREAEEKYKEWLEVFSKSRGMTEEEAERTALAKIIKKHFLTRKKKRRWLEDDKEKKKRLEARHKKQVQGAAARSRV